MSETTAQSVTTVNETGASARAAPQHLLRLMAESMAQTAAWDGDRTLGMEVKIRQRMAEMTAVENEIDRIEDERVAKLKAEAEAAAEAAERARIAREKREEEERIRIAAEKAEALRVAAEKKRLREEFLAAERARMAAERAEQLRKDAVKANVIMQIQGSVNPD